MASTRSKLDEIVESFATLEDPRSHINRRHPLPSVLVIAVLAVLAGAAGPTAIARWAECKAELLTGLLDLPFGIPGKDVFRRVLMLLKPEAFEAGFNAWIARLRDEAVAETVVDRPRAWPRGEADLPAPAGPRGPAGQVPVGGAEIARRGDVAPERGREGEYRDPLLPVQPAGGREAVRPRGAGPLVGGERLPLVP